MEVFKNNTPKYGEKGEVQMFQKNLKSAIQACVPAIAVTTTEWERIVDDIKIVAIEEEMNMFVWDQYKGLVELVLSKKENLNNDFTEVKKVDAVNITATLCEIEKLEKSVFVLLNFNEFFKNPVIIQHTRYVLQNAKLSQNTLIFVSASGHIPPELEKEIIILDYEFPTKKDIEKILTELSTEDSLLNFTRDQIDKIIEAAVGLTRNEAENIIALSLSKNGLRVTEETIKEIKKQKAQTLKKTGVLELYEPEDLPEVGGLDVLKLWLWEREKAFSPEARKFGMPFPKGILVFGIPGTGKSLIAKTIAKQWNMPLLIMGNVLDKYVGESEKKMKEALKQAEAMSPCVLMIDEIEKFFAGVGSRGDSGVSTRVFGQFLYWMQETTAPVFVVATSNDISDLPPELMRKGRFDENFFVDLPSEEERKEIFKIHISRKGREVESFNLEKLAQATPGYTGSEIEQIVISALFRAFAKGQDITTEILLEVAEETPPLSLTMKEKIETMRQWGLERARPASSSKEEEPEKQVSPFIAKRKIRG